MKKTIITAAITAALLAAGSASATKCRTCEIDINIYNSSTTTVAKDGGGAYKSYIWTCEGQDTELETKVIYDQSRNENIPEGTNEIYVWPTNPMHPLTLKFEVEVENLCSETMGEPAVIIDRRELVPAFDDRPLKPWEIEEEATSEE